MLVCGSSIYLGSCTADKDKIPALLARKKTMGPEAEMANIKSAYDKAIDGLKKNPDDLKQYVALASVFISEGRITGDNTLRPRPDLCRQSLIDPFPS